MSPTVRVGPEPSPEGRKPQRYTVEELAEHSGVTPRTIRSYQTQGILSPPEHRGRVAYYSESHLQRLRAIADLKERGLSLAEIRDVVRRREAEERSAAGSRPRSQPASVGERSRPRHEVGSAAPSAPASAQRQSPAAVDVASPEASEPGRRGGLLTAMTVLLVLVLAAGATFVVLDVRHDNAERKRLSREVSDLRGQLSRLGNSPPTPPTTAMPPSSAPPSPPPPVPTTVAGPAVSPSPRTPARTAPTVVVNPPAPAPTTPAPPPPTCPTVSILNLCI